MIYKVRTQLITMLICSQTAFPAFADAKDDCISHARSQFNDCQQKFTHLTLATEQSKQLVQEILSQCQRDQEKANTQCARLGAQSNPFEETEFSPVVYKF